MPNAPTKPAGADDTAHKEAETAANPILAEEPKAAAAAAEEEEGEEEPMNETKEEEEELPVVVAVDEPGAIWEPAEADILSGRGASVNANPGNKRFRALCFSRKHLFDNGNHAAKRRVASDIVKLSLSDFGARFLKRKEDKGPWYEMSSEQALLKACQIMRDHKRPDRLAHRELLAASGNGKKRNRATSTPMDDVPQVPAPEELLVENPFGVHDHDVLSGRGAFVNGHVGNERLRVLAQERKTQFDTGNYSEKRSLATEIVTFVRSLDPPGRFMKRVDPTKSKPVDDSEEANLALEAGWEELSDEKAIHKSCQVMRDIDRADRKDREERKKIRILKKEGNLPDTPQGTAKGASHDTPSSVEVLGGITVGTSEVVDEAVAAAEEAMDKALKAAAGGNKDSDAQVAHI